MVLGSLFRLSTPYKKNGEHGTDSDSSSNISDSDSMNASRGGVTPATSTRPDRYSILTPATSLPTSGYSPSESATFKTPPLTPPSYQSIYNSPPSIAYPYCPTEALGDLPGTAYALELFLSSQMLESEAFCKWGLSGLEHMKETQNQDGVEDGKANELEDKGHMERLYFGSGYGMIQCVKGLMSYEDDVGFTFAFSPPF